MTRELTPWERAETIRFGMFDDETIAALDFEVEDDA